jgi:hypothetical protein
MAQSLNVGDRILVPMIVVAVYPEQRSTGVHTVVRAEAAMGRADQHFLGDSDAVIRANPDDTISNPFEVST